MIALQYSSGFCHIAMRISHKYTYVPPLLNLPQPHGNHGASSRAPCAYSSFPLTTVLHTVVYISALLPEFVPPSPSPYCVQPFFSISVSLLLPSCKSVHRYHSSRFHMCVLIYNICFSFSDFPLCQTLQAHLPH